MQAGLVLGNLFLEATVVGIVCLFFMAMFVVAGIRQIVKERD